MIPIYFIETIKKTAPDYSEIFNTLILDRLELERNDSGYIQISKCSPASLRNAIKLIENTIPISLMQSCISFVKLSVRRHPIEQTLEIFPIFTPSGLLAQLVKDNVARSFRLATIQSSDEFEYNGTSLPVIHEVNTVADSELAGAFTEITLPSGLTSVWTMTPEESNAAADIWDKNIFGHVKVLSSRNEVVKLCMFLRACKTMTSMIGFTGNHGIGELIVNVTEIYNHYFEQYKAFESNRFALSVKNNNRNIVNQPSELENLLKKMPEITISPLLRLEGKKKQRITTTVSTIKNKSKLLSFGIGGW